MSSRLALGIELGIPPPPADPQLPALPSLFQGEAVWEFLRSAYPELDDPPHRLKATQFIYRPGRRALVTYTATWQALEGSREERFALSTAARSPEPVRCFRFPEDPELPGLPVVASALEAYRLLPQFVPLHPRFLEIAVVKYRPTSRAVLRYTVRWRRARSEPVTLSLARVMRPDRVDGLLAARELAAHSGFRLPRLLGCWSEGGAVWLEHLPGSPLRDLIAQGAAPDPGVVLQPLTLLWSAPAAAALPAARNLHRTFRWTAAFLAQVLEEATARQQLQAVVAALGPFAEAWRPTALAHNDFHDDQLLLAPSGDVSLVDFEEVGPGDPLLDVGNLLAHLRWVAAFAKEPGPYVRYRQRFRQAALRRFSWREHELNRREAFALFRLATNPVRKLRRDWPRAAEKGLGLALETLSAED